MLDGDVALITGAGRGVGRATAIRLAALGAALVLNDLDPAPLEATVAEIEAVGGQAVGLPFDITAEDFPDAFVDLARRTYGGAHIVVNNAGWVEGVPAHLLTDDQWRRMQALHLEAPFRLLRAVHPLFTQGRDGGTGRYRKVVNVTSVAGVEGVTGAAHYSSAKAGLIGLTRTLAKEWARIGVTVNAVALGVVDTRLVAEPDPEHVVTTASGDRVALGIPRHVRDLMLDRSALRRPARPEDVAGVIAFLCGPDSDYVTGHVLECTGGLSATP